MHEACSCLATPAGTLPWREALPAGGGGGEGGPASAASPPQEGCAAPLAPGSQISKEQVLQRKLECMEHPQLLFASMPCPKVRLAPWGAACLLPRAAARACANRAVPVAWCGH